MKMNMKRILCLGGLAAVTASHAVTLWDTGAPHPVNFNGADTNLGYTSGNGGAGFEQRWAAIPFTVGAPGWQINQVDVDYFIAAGTTPVNVTYIIWDRTNLDAPTVQHMSGILGAAGPGIDDPRTAVIDDWLHQYTGLNIALGAGDYYFTIHGGTGAGENIAWLTGGDLQDESLEQEFMWRSSTMPGGGFQQYAPANILPGAGMTDPDDRWNPSFTMIGEVVPEPGTFVAIGAGLALLVARRRRK
jgi:hypothetical protein